MSLLRLSAKGIEWVGFALVALIFLFPFVWMILTSVKSLVETTVFPPKWIPSTFHWENFAQAWQAGPFMTYFINSVLVTLSILILQLLTGIPAAYAFARFKFKGAQILFGLTLIALMIPPQITFLPVFIQMSGWGLINTYAPLILPYAASGFGIFMLRQTFKQVPEEVIEAARLDQASEWKILWKIMVPMARPVLVTFGLFSFIYHWNDYFWTLVMTNQDMVRTLPVGIARLKSSEGGVAWNVVMAGNMILVVPILIAFFFAQRQIIKAFVYSGVK
ncbi:carbohydrate ABC transporter permease [Aneurinibacillus sp. Ricciae_BoGa-3]|uniref:carbohydrate ABC transporter permease n=1 Tax=Aneurinibacillus sp. Ricciae_BoGa-3 TaxID=3022697 RepID=UPI00234156C3|nr:carbohydrate ABC transporter permease [Aneurinibacillus sp. Ricciae_BoGa-3]WCK54902.1 carbohydrate ABC transporter permease [Aneurinibacillus sp. Ricciae_BoGa-3]